MVKYRKNKKWNTKSFEVHDISEVDDMIMNKAKELETRFGNIDIVDISIRSVVLRDEYLDNEKHFITIFFAIINEDKRHEI
jgi:hypothetical protein